jgi:hypothetical protein
MADAYAAVPPTPRSSRGDGVGLFSVVVLAWVALERAGLGREAAQCRWGKSRRRSGTRRCSPSSIGMGAADAAEPPSECM